MLYFPFASIQVNILLTSILRGQKYVERLTDWGMFCAHVRFIFIVFSLKKKAKLAKNVWSFWKLAYKMLQ